MLNLQDYTVKKWHTPFRKTAGICSTTVEDQGSTVIPRSRTEVEQYYRGRTEQ